MLRQSVYIQSLVSRASSFTYREELVRETSRQLVRPRWNGRTHGHYIIMDKPDTIGSLTRARELEYASARINTSRGLIIRLLRVQWSLERSLANCILQLSNRLWDSQITIMAFRSWYFHLVYYFLGALRADGK